MARKTDWVSGASPFVTRMAPTARVAGLNRPYGASAASRAPTCHPRCRNAHRSRARTRGSLREPGRPDKQPWPREWSRPFRGRKLRDPSARTAHAAATQGGRQRGRTAPHRRPRTTRGSVTEDVPHAETPYNESINTRITRVSLQEVKRFRVIETLRLAPDPPVDPCTFVRPSQLPDT